MAIPVSYSGIVLESSTERDAKKNVHYIKKYKLRSIVIKCEMVGIGREFVAELYEILMYLQ